jgi:hypothetical protein
MATRGKRRVDFAAGARRLYNGANACRCDDDRTTAHAATPMNPIDNAAPLRHPWRMVSGLGIAQIISWGSLFYAIGVLGPAMARDLGLSIAGVFGAYSAGMLVSGLAAPTIGRRLDRDGGRRWLAIGSVVAALALISIASARTGAEFYAAWVLGGVAMAMTLYDPGFITLAQHFGTRYRTAVTVLTLFGGFASTVFWPLSLYGLDHLGWRATLLAFAGLEILVCLPLHLALVPRRSPRHAAPTEKDARAEPRAPPPRDGRRLAALAAAFALNAFIAGALAAHMPGVLTATGLTAGEAVWAGALIGPMQVTGRLLEMGFGRHLPATRVGLLSLGLLVIALALLLAILLFPDFRATFAFAALYGVANGVITIVRGTAPAELFGREGYGALLGRIAAPTFVAKAVAPVGFAIALVPLAASGAIALLLALGIVSLAFFALAAHRAPRHTAA